MKKAKMNIINDNTNDRSDDRFNSTTSDLINENSFIDCKFIHFNNNFNDNMDDNDTIMNMVKTIPIFRKQKCKENIETSTTMISIDNSEPSEHNQINYFQHHHHHNNYIDHHHHHNHHHYHWNRKISPILFIFFFYFCLCSSSSHHFITMAQSASSSPSKSSFGFNNNRILYNQLYHHLHHHHHHHLHYHRRRRIFPPQQQQQNSMIADQLFQNSHQYYRNQYQPFKMVNDNNSSNQLIPSTSWPLKTNRTSNSYYNPQYHHQNNILKKIMGQKIKSRRHRHTYYYTDDANPSPMVSSSSSTIAERNDETKSSSSPSSIIPGTIIQIPKVIYQMNWIKSDDELPICSQNQVCNKIDTYSTPWIEKQCRCPLGQNQCSMSLSANDDDNTIQVEKTKQYKLCNSVKKLPTCRYFRDVTWTITTTSVIKNEQEFNSLINHKIIDQSSENSDNNNQNNGNYQQQNYQNENITKQEVKCVCPPNSVAYILKHQVYKTPEGQLGYRYYFVCSPETKLRCKRKEPCRLFTAKKRPKVEAVTTTTLCQCSNGYSCPTNHRQTSVIMGTSYPLDNIRTYSGYCYRDDNNNEDDNTTSKSTTTTTTSSDTETTRDNTET